MVAIEIAHQANAERDIVEIIAVDVATIDLAPPAIAYFDLTIPSRCSIADHEMVSQPILHPANMPVVIVERRRVSLPRPAIVHDDELPAAARDWSAVDLVPH